MFRRFIKPSFGRGFCNETKERKPVQTADSLYVFAGLAITGVVGLYWLNNYGKGKPKQISDRAKDELSSKSKGDLKEMKMNK